MTPQFPIASADAALKSLKPAFQRWQVPVSVAALIGLAISVMSFNAAQEYELARLQAPFENITDDRAEAMQRHVDVTEEILENAAGLFTSDLLANRQEFRVFIDYVLKRHPEIMALEWIPRLKSADRTSMEQLDDAIMGMHGVKDMGPAGREMDFVKSVARDEYYPLWYIEPFDKYKHLIGYDYGHSPDNRPYMDLARDRASFSVTHWRPLFRLELDDTSRAGYRVFYPVYDGKTVPADTEARRQALKGFVAATFHLESLVRETYRGVSSRGLDIYISESVDSPKPLGKALHFTLSPEGPKIDWVPRDLMKIIMLQSGLNATRTITSVDQKWILHARPGPVFLSSQTSRVPALVMGLSLVLTGLASLYVYSVITRAAAVEQLVETRTQSLREEIAMRKQVETELINAKTAAENANRAKSDFLARMSHELRTPLNSVIGFSAILLKNKPGNLNDQDKLYLERISSNGRHLLGLINDVLDLSKIEAGRAEVEMSPVMVDELVKETLSELEGRTMGTNVTLRSDLPSSLEPVLADRAKLKQVLINLVGNAVKFTERGSVTVRITTDAGTHRPTRIDVIDTGIGIPKNHIGSIFDAFDQGDASRARKYGGTGLGLPISRSLLHLMGWDLSVASEDGKGSTFSIQIGPVSTQPSEPQTMSPPEVSVADGCLVLVIDDNADARAVLVDQLSELGCRCLTAADGPEAVRVARQEKPDLITLDLIMPQMSGWAVVRQLREDEATRDIPVIVVSILANENQGKIPGVAAFVEKPISRPALASAIRKHMRPERRAS